MQKMQSPRTTTQVDNRTQSAHLSCKSTIGQNCPCCISGWNVLPKVFEIRRNAKRLMLPASGFVGLDVWKAAFMSWEAINTGCNGGRDTKVIVSFVLHHVVFIRSSMFFLVSDTDSRTRLLTYGCRNMELLDSQLSFLQTIQALYRTSRSQRNADDKVSLGGHRWNRSSEWQNQIAPRFHVFKLPPRALSTEFLALNSAELLHQSEADFLVPDKLPFASTKDTQIQSFVHAG